MMSEIEIIEDFQKLRRLETEWNDLLLSTRANTLFLRWEWICSWLDVTGETRRLLAIVVRNSNGSLVGLAPFYLSHFHLLKIVPYGVLRIMADFATGSEYGDWIVHRDHEEEVCRSIAKTLCRMHDRWDCIWIPNVAAWTGACDRIVRACEDEGFYCQVRPTDFGYSDLPEGMDKYTSSLSSNMRQKVRRQAKKILNGTGARISRCTTEAELPRFLDALFELHYKRWKQLGQEGTFRKKPDEAFFYREFTKRALRNGWLWLFGLEDEGELKAVQIGYVYNNVFHQMQEGFDPDYLPGAGNVLRIKIMETCIAEGITGYDFLGEMTEHKRSWLAKERLGCDIFIGRRSLKNYPLFSKGIWPTGRFLRPAKLHH